MDPDDLAYRRSVRNMVAVLAAIVITVFAALFVPDLLFPPQNVYPSSVTFDSPSGFTMHLTVNLTRVASTWGVALAGWVNSTSSSIYNITASDSWGVSPQGLWTRSCTPGFPIGLGLMQGRYTQDNYTLGTLLPVPQVPNPPCPEATIAPGSFAFEPHTSKALVVLGGSPSFWTIVTSLHYTETTPGYQLQPGVYTAVFADEWGDVVTADFLAA